MSTRGKKMILVNQTNQLTVENLIFSFLAVMR